MGPQPRSRLFPYATLFRSSLVFFAILTSVLLAVLVNARFKIRHIWDFYALLFGTLALNLFVRPETLLLQDRKSTPLNSSHANILYAVVFLKKKNAHPHAHL